MILTPAAQALREMAKQIGDRDNSVRNAALNAITETYFQVIVSLIQVYIVPRCVVL